MAGGAYEDEEEVETGHDGRRHVDVLLERTRAIVAAADGVGRGQDGRARVQRRLDAGLGDRDRLLFHGLVDRHLGPTNAHKTRSTLVAIRNCYRFATLLHTERLIYYYNNNKKVGGVYLIAWVHFVELVDAADAVVGEHQGAGLDDELVRLLVADHGRRQTGRRRRLARRVDGARRELGHLSPEKKREKIASISIVPRALVKLVW